MTQENPATETDQLLEDSTEHHTREDVVPYVSFLVGDEEYIVDIDLVREIIKKVRITSLPKSAAFVEGIVDLRGAIIPVVNLRYKLNLPVDGPEQNIIIVESRTRLVGLIVDRVEEVIRVAADALEPRPGLARDGRAHIDGVVRHGERLLIHLDVEALFSDEELELLSEAGDS